MSVFAISRQVGVGRTRFVDFRQVGSRQKGERVTPIKAVCGVVPFGQAGLAWSGARAFREGYGGLRGRLGL